MTIDKCDWTKAKSTLRRTRCQCEIKARAVIKTYRDIICGTARRRAAHSGHLPFSLGHIERGRTFSCPARDRAKANAKCLAATKTSKVQAAIKSHRSAAYRIEELDPECCTFTGK